MATYYETPEICQHKFFRHSLYNRPSRYNLTIDRCNSTTDSTNSTTVRHNSMSDKCNYDIFKLNSTLSAEVLT